MTSSITRRASITALGGAAASSLSWPLAARAQQPAGRVRRVGIVMPYAEGDADYQIRVRLLRQELGRLGWTDGGNIQFDERWTTDNMDRVRAEAASLMASNPDAVVAIGGRVVPVLMQLSRSVPIVVAGAGDPVGTGWVASLARPGGNVTGFTMFELSMFGKTLETLKQIAPATVRVALVFNPENPNSVVYRRALEEAAGPLAIEPVITPIHGIAELDRAIASLAERRGTGVFFLPDVTVNALRAEAITLVGRLRCPRSRGSHLRQARPGVYVASRVIVREPPDKWVASCPARSRATCRSSSRRNINSCSTSRPPGLWGWSCRRRCSRSPTR